MLNTYWKKVVLENKKISKPHELTHLVIITSEIGSKLYNKEPHAGDACVLLYRFGNHITFRSWFNMSDPPTCKACYDALKYCKFVEPLP